MPTPDCSPNRSPNGSPVSTWRDVARRIVAGLLVAVGAACGGVSDMLTPGERDAALPAQVSVLASVAASVSSVANEVSLVVASEYVRRDGGRAALGTQTVTLSASASQAVPLSVDLAKCLGDDDREAASARDRSCTVYLHLRLMVNGAEVDRQVIGPLRLSPGARTGVAQPVSLYDIAALEISAAGIGVVGVADTIRLAQGQSLPLAATIRDRSGRIVTDRAVRWTSATPAIATISSPEGIVSALALGEARVVATIGTLSREVAMRVLRVPSLLRIVAGDGSGRGTIRSTPPGIDCRIEDGTTTGTCAFTFPGEALVTLSSTADAGSAPLQWGEECASAQPGGSCVVDMVRPRIVAASYTALRRITIAPFGGDGSGRVTGPAGLDCRLVAQGTSGVCAVDVVDGTAVVLVATPEGASAPGGARHVLVDWGGGCVGTTNDACRFVATAPRSATVRFAAPRTVRVALEGSGTGRVVAAGGIDCQRANGAAVGRCAGEGEFGSTLTLTAIADARAVFAGWGPGCASVEGTRCVVTLTQARTVTATFTAKRRVEVAAGAGDGYGRVTSVSGIDCRLSAGTTSGACAIDVEDNAVVSLLARAETGLATRQTFVEWGGACASATGTTCAVSADEDATTVVTAHFADEQRLSVVLEGSGNGRVVAVLGVSCVRANGATSGACDATAPFGTMVTLTAIPDPQSSFAGWSGACASAPGTTCVTTLDEARTVTAIFKRKQAILTIIAKGPVAGTVAVNGETACSLGAGQGSVTCAVSLDAGTLLTVTGVPLPGGQLVGYSGACNGAGMCQTVLSEDREVTVQFDRRRPTLAVQLTGSGSGSVSVGGTMFCSLSAGQGSTTCSSTFAYGTVVQLTGAATAGSVFGGLTGDCTGTGPCSLTLTRDMQVGAQFSLPPVTLTVSVFGRGSGSLVSGGTLSCTRLNGTMSGVCTETVPYGTTITVTAEATPGSRLEIWNGACTGVTGTTCTLRLTGNVSAGAAFTRTSSPAP